MAKKADETKTDAAEVPVSTGDYFDSIAKWMRDNGVTNPREVPDAVVEALRAGFTL